MQLHYAGDLWNLFGVSYLEQDRLAWWEFEALTGAADQTRREREKASRRGN